MIQQIVIPQAFEFLFTPKRYKAMYGGRGSGKSHSVARALLVMGAQKPMRIVCAREIQKSIKDSVHKLLSDIIRENGLSSFYTVQEQAIKGANGTEFIFRGLKHNTRDLKSLEGADICWIEEAEIVSDNSYEILVPTIRKNGSEIWATFNVKNLTDPSYVKFVSEAGDDTISKKVSWRDNPFFPDVLKAEMLKLQKVNPEAHAHIWEGEPDTRRSGAVFAKQIAAARADQRITRVPYDPISEVFTAWDLGFGDTNSIWWLQFVGRELRWLDYYENDGQLIGHYIEEVKKRSYRYSMHFLPHDGAHGNVRGLPVTDQLTAAGLKNKVLEREQSIDPGIDLLRQTIAYSVFDEVKCKDGLRALEAYAYEWNDDTAQFSRLPKHDWASNGSSAARYAAIGASTIKTLISAKPRTVSFALDTGTMQL